MLVALDVGHIGKPVPINDKGARYKNLNEADMVLLYAVITRGLLESAGIQTILLCHTSYNSRHAFCKGTNVDVHLQLHLNAAKGSYSLIGYRDTHKHLCYPLARIMADEFEEILPVSKCTLLEMTPRDRRIVCTMGGIPSLLVEPLFLDNDEHYDYILNGSGVEDIAEVITSSIVKWEENE